QRTDSATIPAHGSCHRPRLSPYAGSPAWRPWRRRRRRRRRDCERPAEEQHEAPARARAAAAPASWACAAEAAGASALGGGLVVGHEAEHEGLDVEDLSFVPWFMVDSKWAAAASVDCFRLSTRCS
ncbi:unnamed protein product, partial [Prorocentrum cordatum]